MAKSRSQKTAVSQKIQKIYHEEKKKPVDERRPRDQIIAMAHNMVRKGKK